jgi:hypothetical protein
MPPLKAAAPHNTPNNNKSGNPFSSTLYLIINNTPIFLSFFPSPNFVLLFKFSLEVEQEPSGIIIITRVRGNPFLQFVVQPVTREDDQLRKENKPQLMRRTTLQSKNLIEIRALLVSSGRNPKQKHTEIAHNLS